MHAVCLSSVRPGVYSVKCWEGVCHRYTETLGSTAAHTNTTYTIGVRPPRFEGVCIRESGYTSNALFCILDVWHDFTRVAVLR